ncbi:MAG: DnaJ domain-containing protein [Arenimonas sp.]|nr:DnaJ domain-containing protein [Arenimonas sp.]MBP6309356.1 DnaJ domain-containing protein [Arenimonas sp.]
MEFKDYYKILNVESTASDDEIKKSYRRLARKFHPDVSKEKGAEEQFKAINEAYEVLKDKEKRSQYDQLKANGYRPGDDFRPPPGASGGAGGFQYDFNDMGGAGGFSDFFESLFGAGRRPQQQQAPTGSRVKLSIPLEKSYSGGKQKIRIGKRTFEINIPVGIKPGQSIRLAGQGEHQGDLMIEIDYKEHPEFELDGLNILYTLTLMPWQAALGANISVPTLGGLVELKVPANSDTGKRLRLKGRGMPSKTIKGDQLIEIEVSAPSVKNEQQRALYEQMALVFKED